jgi:hypothetical protein
MQATTLPFVVVNEPGQRYHPAVIAQGVDTLGSMPKRLEARHKRAVDSPQLLKGIHR